MDGMNCKFCNILLDDNNWFPSARAKKYYVCKSCKNKLEYKRCLSISINIEVNSIPLNKILNCLDCGVVLNNNNWLSYHRSKGFRLCKECNKVRKNKENLLLKEQTIMEYGGKCVCCADRNVIFLTMDHIDGNGAEHRKTINSKYKMTGVKFYRWLRQQGYPKDNYRILCFNCNFAMHVLGKCPHQDTK